MEGAREAKGVGRRRGQADGGDARCLWRCLLTRRARHACWHPPCRDDGSGRRVALLASSYERDVRDARAAVVPAQPPAVAAQIAATKKSGGGGGGGGAAAAGELTSWEREQVELSAGALAPPAVPAIAPPGGTAWLGRWMEPPPPTAFAGGLGASIVGAPVSALAELRAAIATLDATTTAPLYSAPLTPTAAPPLLERSVTERALERVLRSAPVEDADAFGVADEVLARARRLLAAA